LGVLRILAKRGGFVRALAVLSIALVGVLATAQMTHSHAEDSSVSHHTCTICATAHAGVTIAPVAAAPVLNATALATPAAEVAPIFRAITVHCIRPPPSV
jgi:hypothetical protein